MVMPYTYNVTHFFILQLKIWWFVLKYEKKTFFYLSTTLSLFTLLVILLFYIEYHFTSLLTFPLNTNFIIHFFKIQVFLLINSMISYFIIIYSIYALFSHLYKNSFCPKKIAKFWVTSYPNSEKFIWDLINWTRIFDSTIYKMCFFFFINRKDYKKIIDINQFPDVDFFKTTAEKELLWQQIKTSREVLLLQESSPFTKKHLANHQKRL